MCCSILNENDCLGDGDGLQRRWEYEDVPMTGASSPPSVDYLPFWMKHPLWTMGPLE